MIEPVSSLAGTVSMLIELVSMKIKQFSML